MSDTRTPEINSIEMPPCTVEGRVENGVDIVCFSGSNRLVMRDAPEIRGSIKAIVDAGEGKLVIDMSPISFIDDSGLSALISPCKSIHQRRGRIALAGLGQNVDALFRLTRLDEVFEIFPTVEEAMQALLN